MSQPMPDFVNALLQREREDAYTELHLLRNIDPAPVLSIYRHEWTVRWEWVRPRIAE